MNSRPVYCSQLYGNESQPDEEDAMEITKSNTLVNETGFLIRIQQLLPALETLVITQEGSKFLILTHRNASRYITEGASDQFHLWIFYFWPYGQPRVY